MADQTGTTDGDTSAHVVSALSSNGRPRLWCPAEQATVLDVIEANAGRFPGSPVVHAPGRAPLTFAQLERQVARTIARLRELGISPGDRVAVVLPNGAELAIAFLSIASAATCAPLNPAYTTADFVYYLSDLQARALVVPAGDSSPAVDAAAELNMPVIELVPDATGLAGSFTLSGTSLPRESSNQHVQPNDIALVLHTSGTTSRPKIVPLTHANLCASARQCAEVFDLGMVDRCLNIMPLFHIHGLVGALLSSLSAGASVVCTPGFDAAQFFAWMDEFSPTWYTAVPTMHQAVLARAGKHRETIARSPLRFIRSCSSPLAPQVMRQLEETFGVPTIESYGMTEAAHQVSSNPLPPARRKPGSVGMAAGTRVAIVDEAGDLLPPGTTGEVVVRGKNVMHGYENNPEANGKAFADGWFCTGDLGYLDEEGYLFLTGRLKELINRAGEKIAPREVDEVLLSHPAIAQAVAFALPDAHLGEAVAAAVVLKPGKSVTELELMQFAATHLTAFKVPQSIVFLDALPKGPTGKIQRVGLAERLGLHPDLDTHGQERDEEQAPPAFAPPRTEREVILAHIWAQVLGIKLIGVWDDFLELGGDSLQAARILARVQATFHVDLPISAFFAAPTIADLARLLDEMETSSTK